MPAPWSAKGSKSAPLVAADQFLILDSEDATPATQNKRVTLSTVQANLVTSVDANDFNITELNSISINDSANNNTFTISSSVDLAANRVLNLPLLTTDDTFAFLNVANIFTQDQDVVTETLQARMRLTNYNDSSASAGGLFVARRARGTESSPTAIMTNDSILSLPQVGYDGTAFGVGALIQSAASENWSVGNHGTELRFSTTANLDDTPTVRLTIEEDGTTSFEDNSITNIASILLNDSDDSNSYTILGGALTGNFDVTIPAITANDTFALLGVSQTFTGILNFVDDNLPLAPFNLTSFGFESLIRQARANGTLATPLAINNNDIITETAVRGFNGTSFVDCGNFSYRAVGDFSATNRGTRFEIRTQPSNIITPPRARLNIGSEGETSFEDNSIINIASILLNDSDDSNSYTILGGALTGNFNVTFPGITADDGFALVNTANAFLKKQTIVFVNDTIADGLVINNSDGSFTFGNATATANEFAAQMAVTTLGNTNGFTTDVSITPADTGSIPVSVLNLRQSDDTDVENRPLWEIQNNGTSQALVEADGTWDFQANTLTDLADPVSAQDAATKNYVDNVALGLSWKEPVRVASTADIDLSVVADPSPVDGVTLANNDRILLKNQSAPIENGIYDTVTATDPTTWTRSSDMAATSDAEGAATFVIEGTVNASNAFVQTATPAIVGTDPLTFVQFTGLGQITAGSGLTKTLNVLNVGQGTGITVNADDVALTIPVVVSSGGTGATTLDSTAVLTGNGTGTINSSTNLTFASSLLTGFESSDTATNSFEFQLRRQRTSDPEDIQAGDSLGKITFLGADTAVPAFAEGGRLEFLATENWDDTDHGTELEISTTANLDDTPTIRLIIEADGTANFEGNDITGIKSIGLQDSDDSNLYTIFGGALTDNLDVTIPAITANDTFALLNVSNVFTQNQTITFPDDTIIDGLTVSNTDGGFTFGNATATADEFAALVNVTTVGSTNGFNTTVTTPVADDTGTVPITILNAEQADDTPITTRPLWELHNNDVPQVSVGADGTWDFEGNTITNAVLEATLSDGSIYVGDENNVSASIPAGLETKEDCRLATTTSDGDIDLSTGGLLTIDSVTTVAADRVLVKNQINASENGIYAAAVGTWSRTTDADADSEVNNGMFTLVTSGTVNANTAFVLSTPNPITVDTTDLTFDEFSFSDIAHLNSTQTFTGENTFRKDVLLIKDSDGAGVFSNTVYNNSLGNGPFFDGFRAKGTEATPLTVTTSTTLTEFGAFAFDGNSFELGGLCEFSAGGTWSDTSRPTFFTLATTDVDSTSLITRLRIVADGTASFEDNSIINIASILLNDSDDSNSYTILGGALSDDFDVTIPAITTNDTFALLGVINVFTADQDITTDATQTRLRLLSHNDAVVNGPIMEYTRTRGTTASPTAIQANDAIMTLSGVGHDGTSFGLGSLLRTNASENWSVGNHGTNMIFNIVLDGETTTVNSMTLKGDAGGRAEFPRGALFGARIQGNQGGDVASADAITLGLTTDGNYFDITGVATINHMINTNWQAGSVVTLQFDGATVTNGAGGAVSPEADFALASGADFITTGGDTLTVAFDGTFWREISRSVN